MVANQNDKNKLINEAIDDSIKFEELMDKTDFDSWLDGKDPEGFKKYEQAITPFREYEKSEKRLRNICSRMKNKGNKLLKSVDKSSAERYIVYKLFESKDLRIEARKSFKKEAEKEKYEKAIYPLLSALTVLQNPEVVNTNKKWEILLYNDLSICYSVHDDSSMSRGYAEESKKIMEDETSYMYKEFFQKVNAVTTTITANIKNYYFFSSRLYDLYTVALFNQAVAQGRSYYYHDAEKNFMRIIKYAEKKKKGDTPLRNFNYYSALLNLSDLYIDMGRGEEAINFLNKIKKGENDIPYWNACITKINALIDQSKYDEARKNLNNIFKSGNDFTPIKRHRITSVGFNGLNCFMRCIIENAKNDLRKINKTKEDKLLKAVKTIEKKIKIMSDRQQEAFIIKAYKQLSDIYIILKQGEEDSKYDKKIIKYLVKYISEKDEINDLAAFIKSKKDMGKWIDKCNDLEFLQSFTYQIITKVQQDEKMTKEFEARDQRQDNGVNNHGEYNKDKLRYIALLKMLEEKITKECEDKDQLSRAERIVRKINEAKKGKEYEEFIDFLSNIPYEGEKENKYLKSIYKRLDINEKEFDKVLFERSEIEGNHIAEVIILRRWNSFSPGLFRESTGSLGGGYLLRIKKYLFSFSDIVAKENERQKLLNFLHDLGLAKLAKIMKGAKYSEEDGEIRITRNNKRIATLKIKEGLCYFVWDNHDEFKIGVVKEKDHKKYIYSKDSDVENIVIDPGYNFLQNLRREGFYINDIDTIIITHSHLDHCAELLPVMDLIYQFNKRYKDTLNEERPKKKVNLYLSQGAYRKFSNYIDDPEWKKQLKDVIILENLSPNNFNPLDFEDLTISAIPTHHWDLGGAHSIGLKIDFSIGKKKLSLGFTGDTPWDPKIKKAFEKCDFVCVHMGGIKYEEIGYTDDRYNLVKKESRRIEKKDFFTKLKKTYDKANHLLFHGTKDFLECYVGKDDPLIIIGEFGEELKYGLRKDLCVKLTKEVNVIRKDKGLSDIVCLPGDIGLYIGIDKDGKKKIQCNFCEEFVEQKEIKIFSYGREDALHYICETCYKTLTNLQKQAVIEHRVTRH